MPGRSFASPADFNDQFSDWLTVANNRVVRTLKARPVDLVEADRAAMLALPPAVLHLVGVIRVAQPCPARPRLLRPHRHQIDTNDYSVDPRAIGSRVDVAADLDTVRVRHGAQLITEHHDAGRAA